MQVISTRDFRSNQTTFLNKALNGEEILLTSRVGTFRIVPVDEDDTMTKRICRGLEQVKGIMDGKLPRRTAQDLLDEI